MLHSTWARTYSSKPARYIQPTSVEEVQRLCKTAAESGTTITVVGSGHSPSILTMTTGWLVNLDRMSRTIDVRRGEYFTDVVVEAGKRLYQLNEELAQEGLALQNLGSISDQSVAGVISTGTHGSSAWHGLISEQIVELSLVTANGEIVNCSDTENKDLFKFALLSLGKLGVIIRATIRAVPAFNLKTKQEVVSFDRFLDEMWMDFFTSAEFHRVWWYPYTGKCVVWRADRTSEPDGAAPRSFYGTWIGRFLYQALLLSTVVINPNWTPWVERWLFRNQFGLDDTVGTEKAVISVQRSDKAINMDVLFSQFVNEWALPLVNGPSVLRELKKEIDKNEFYVHAPFEIRASNTTLPNSFELPTPETPPQKGRIFGNISRPYLDTSPKLPYAVAEKVSNVNLTLNLNATMYRPFYVDSETYLWYTRFEEICSAAGGKPHWAKNFLGRNINDSATLHHMRGIKPDVENWYGPNLLTWKKLRGSYDPTGVFDGNPEWMSINGLD